MCWKCSRAGLKVAEKDIPVFKILFKWTDDFLEAYYNEFYYCTGIEYSGELDVAREFPGHYYIVDRGFHSYSPKCVITATRDTILITWGMETLDYFDRNCNLVRADCIIPKGSKYYVNDRGEYVSDHIKVIETSCLTD